MANLQFSDPAVFNGKIYFKHIASLYAYDPNDAEVGCSSTGKSSPLVGSGCFTRVLTNVSGAGGSLNLYIPNGNSYQFVPPSLDSKIVLFAQSGSGQKQLWQTDGTVAGTSIAHQISGGYDLYLAYVIKIPGTNDLFHYNVSGSTITMWRYSAQTVPQIQSFVSIPGTCINEHGVDITKTKLRIRTCEQIFYEVDLTTKVAKKLSDRNLSNATGFGSDGFYYFDAASGTGKLFRRNFDKTVEEITGLDISKRGYGNYSVLNKFSVFNSKTLTIGCATATDCDLYQITGTAATKWAEFPANIVPSGTIEAFNGTNYTTDANAKLYSVSNAGTVAEVFHNSTAITGVWNLNVGLDEMLFASYDGNDPSSLYRMTSAGIEKIYTQPTVNGATIYYIDGASISLNEKRYFLTYYTNASYVPFLSTLSQSFGSNSVQSVTDSLIPITGGSFDSFGHGSGPTLFAGRWYFLCRSAAAMDDKMCSDNLTFTDRRVEFANGSSHPLQIGDKLFAWRYGISDAGIWMIDANGNLSSLTMPSGLAIDTGNSIVIGKFIIFTGYSDATGSELYITDGTTTKLLYDIAGGAISSFPNIQGVAGDDLVVSVEHGLNRGLIFLDIAQLR
jgi:ELWxxDGT repeat protein